MAFEDEEIMEDVVSGELSKQSFSLVGRFGILTCI